MAGLREIQGRIRSIEDTRKITGAMYMISSTKLKKAKKDLEKTEPYFYMLQSTIERIMRHLPEMEHPYFEDTSKEASRIGLLVITGDKGLAGAYNHNVLKLAQQFLDCAGKQVSLFVVGELEDNILQVGRSRLQRILPIPFRIRPLTEPDGSAIF